MPSISAWLGETARLRAWTGGLNRSDGVDNIIQDKPASIIITREGSALSAQTVRIDIFGASTQERQSMGQNALQSTQRLLVLGYRNHATIADTNIQAGDQFKYDGQFYRVVHLEPAFTDRVEAVAEAME